MSIDIKLVETKKDLAEFINLPWKLYKDSPNWVPPLKLAMQELLDQKKHPFYANSKVELYLGIKDGHCSGRIAIISNKTYNDFHKENLGFFGFYECSDESDLSMALFNKAFSRLKEFGHEKVQGPMNPSTNYECGLLVDGLEDPPQLMMTYNPKYYHQQMIDSGLEKVKDLIAYSLDLNFEMPSKIVNACTYVQRKSKISLRPVNLKDWDNEVKKMLEVYNDAWEKNWGFVPMSEAEFLNMAKEMKQIVNPNLILMAEVGDEIAGFAVGLPDYNQVFKRITNGKLLPTGIFKFLFGKKHIKRARIITLGLKKKYRSNGIASLFYTRLYDECIKAGYPHVEMSWILEDNMLMRKPIELMGGEPYKTYRIYQTGL